MAENWVPVRMTSNRGEGEYNDVREASGSATPTLGPPIRHSFNLPPLKAVPKIRNASQKT